jgi:DNA polymerase-3 subunit epsilon
VDSFLAIDYETANGDRRSACSVGISHVENGLVVQTFQHLIKPPTEFGEFDPFNVMIHGIQSKDVKNSKSFDHIWKEIEAINPGYKLPFVCHYSGFDIRVTQDLFLYYGINIGDIAFFDTLTIAKKLWPDLINHKLSTLSKKFDIELDHHVASSDAEACARIALRQIMDLNKLTLIEVAAEYGYKLGLLNASGVKTMSDFKNYGSTYSHGPYDPKSASSKDVAPDREINAGSDLYGQYVVFTGELTSMSRKEAIQLAVNNGAAVTSSVSKKTGYLVVGISDFIDFENGKKTRKLLDTEKLQQAGQPISIIDEEDFIRMTSF